MNRLLGKKLGMSRTHFYCKLKAIIDLHPTEFIQTFRLKNAVLLLKNNYGNISEVAFSIGFNSLTYFTRLFKKHYGMTPSDYIQLCSENKFSTTEFFIGFAEFFEVNYDQLYGDVGVMDKEMILKELNEKYNLTSKIKTKRLF